MRGDTAEILIIGAAILDILVRPADEQVFRTGSYAAEDIRMSVGGDALNEATILARMGKTVSLETVLGTDRAGDYLAGHIRDCGIQMPEACVQQNLTTGINVVLVDQGGARHFLTNPHSSLRSLCLSDIRMPFPERAKLICFASIFVFPRIRAAELRRIFSQAKAQGKLVCADMTKCKNGETLEEMADAFSYLDYLLPNEEEAMLLTRTDTVEEAADALYSVGVKTVVIKCGARGAYVKTGAEAYRVPAQPDVHAIDTTGAGDSFVAGFLFALSEGKNLRDCVTFANCCGARAVQAMGATEWLSQTEDSSAIMRSAGNLNAVNFG